MKFLASNLISTRRATVVLCMMFVLLAALNAQEQTPVSDLAKTTIPISDCATINKPGRYILTNNLVCPNGGNSQLSGIIITANSITLHLAGYSINAAGSAIDAENVANVAIVGPGTVSSLEAAVSLSNVTKSQLIGVTCSNAITCITASGVGNKIMANKLSNYELGISGGGQGNLYLGNECSGGNEGIQVISGQHDLIEGNNCGGNSPGAGVYVTGTSETVVGNKADGNAVGISITGTGNHVRNNEATNNTTFDLEDFNGVCGKNTWKLNAFTTANLSCIN